MSQLNKIVNWILNVKCSHSTRFLKKKTQKGKLIRDYFDYDTASACSGNKISWLQKWQALGRVFMIYVPF